MEILKEHRKGTNNKHGTLCKKTHFRIIGFDGREKFQINGKNHIFNKIIKENFSKLRKDTPKQK